MRPAASGSVVPWASATCTASWKVAVYRTSARMPSAYAFCSISSLRTSGWWMIVTRGAVLSVIWVRSAPCTRVLA